MNYLGPYYLECDCGEDVELDDYWQPGDVVRCDYCGLRHLLVDTPTDETPAPGRLTRLGAGPLTLP